MTQMRQRGVLCHQCGKAVRVLVNMGEQRIAGMDLPRDCPDQETCRTTHTAGIFDREFDEGSKNFMTK